MIYCLLFVATGLVLARTEPDQAVTRGRQALDHRWSGYPWYDSETDGLRPIEISKPPAPERKASARNASSSRSREGQGEGQGNEGSSDWSLGGPDFGGFSAVMLEILKWTLWSIVAGVLLVVVFLLVRAYFRDGNLRWTRRKEKSKDNADERRRIEALPFPVKATKLDFLAEARRFHEEGQYGEAVKYLFSYQLVQLDKHRIVRLARGKTNRQYLREMVRRGRAPLGGLLEQTMLAFEDFFFGNHPIERSRFEACWSRLDEFEAQLKGEPG